MAGRSGKRRPVGGGYGQAARFGAHLGSSRAVAPVAAGGGFHCRELPGVPGLVLPRSTAGRLRFHQGVRHPSGGVWPAMMALVTDGADDRPLGIHRTLLAPAGGGKAAVRPQRMMLGPCAGGAVRLAEADLRVMVGEGIETCLAAMQATGLPAWAALSTSGMRRLDLPECIREVVVLADADPPGEAAAEAAARRWQSEGRRVRIARPPVGKDFNDALVIEHEDGA